MGAFECLSLEASLMIARIVLDPPEPNEAAKAAARRYN
jgi:hypothetical protein